MGDMLNILNDNTGDLVSNMMRLSNMRQKVVAQNIANANTPDYTRRAVKFSEELADVVKNQNSTSELPSLDVEMYKDTTNEARMDGNNVVLPEELNQLMQNSLQHRLLSRIRSTRGEILKLAAKGPK